MLTDRLGALFRLDSLHRCFMILVIANENALHEIGNNTRLTLFAKQLWFVVFNYNEIIAHFVGIENIYFHPKSVSGMYLIRLYTTRQIHTPLIYNLNQYIYL